MIDKILQYMLYELNDKCDFGRLNWTLFLSYWKLHRGSAIYCHTKFHCDIFMYKLEIRSVEHLMY